MSRVRWDTRLLALVVAGAVALAAAGVLGYVTVRDAGDTDTDDGPDVVARSADTRPETRRVVSRRGGFVVRVPVDLEVRRMRGAVHVTDPRRSLVVRVGPFGAGSLDASTRQLLGTIRDDYTGVRVLGRQRERVDDRPALVSYGRARNADGVRLRFAVVMVRDRPRNYAIATFAAAGTDPAAVLPRVGAVIDSFRVR